MSPGSWRWLNPSSLRPANRCWRPTAGRSTRLLCICKGSITGRLGMAAMAGQFEYEVGDLFPVGAALANRPVTATYSANEATTCLRLPAARMQELAAMSAPFADFLNRRVVQYLELARKAVHASWAAQPLAEQTLEARLGSLPAREPLTCATTTPLQDALTHMHERQVGSIIVLDAAGAPHGILTRHDILGRVTLPQRPLSTAIAEVMSAPLHGLTVDHTLQDAALAMSRHGIRHCR
jgi:CBS domain-containing protein